jgi:hypothetical protein
MNAIANTTSAELKIVETRAELERLLIDEPEHAQSSGVFPRSRTLKLLTSHGGIVLLTVAAGGLLVLRPSLIKRAIRFIPMGPVVSMLASRFLRNR